jgi:HEAT repeat protein
VKIVKEGPQERRDRAARLLADLDDEAVPALVALVKDGSKDIREAAAVSLSTIGEASVKPLVALLPGAMKDARETIRAILFSIAADDPELAAIVVKEALDLLKSRNSDVRGVGSVLVGKFGNADSMPAIIDALCAADEGVRRSAISCTVLLGETAVPDLVHCLGAEDGKVADAATEALSYIGTAAVPALTRVMKAPVTQIRGCAICALGNMRHRPSTPAIIDALEDAEKGVRADAQAALESITGQKLAGKPAWQGWWNDHKDDPEPRAGNPAPSSEKAGSK